MALWQEIFKNKRSFGIFIPLVLLYATSYFQRTALPGTIYNTLVNELGLSAVQMANLGASFIYTYAICQLISGVMVDHFCGVRVTLTGGLVFLAGSFLFPLCSSLPMLYLSRMLTGIGASTMFLSVVRETDRLFGRKNYAVMFGIAYFCGYGGGLMGSLPFERLCTIFPWRHILLGAAVVSLVLYLILLLCRNRVPLPPVSKTPFSLKPFIFVLKNPLTWMTIIAGNVNFCIYFVVQTFFGKKFLQDFAGFSSAAASGVIFALTLICMFTMLTSSFLTRMTGNRRRPLVITACGIGAASTIFMILAIACHLPGWVFAVIYCLFAMSAGIPPIFSMVMQELNSKDIVGQAAATSNMFGYLGVAVSSQLIGLLLDCFDKVELNGNTVYSADAYLTLFIILAAVSAFSFLMSFRIPETRGHYLHLHIN